KKILIAAVAIALLLLGTLFVKSQKTVMIAYDGQEIQVSTLANTVENVLCEQNITVGDDDKIIPRMNEQIKDGMEIVIHRAVEVKLIDGQVEKNILTTQTDVKNLIDSLNIRLEKDDKIEPKLEEPIGEDRVIEIIRVSREVVVETQELPFQTIFKNNNSLEKGKTQKIQEGREGLKEIKFEVLYENGVEIEREIIEENIVEGAVNEIIEKGTLAMVATSRGDIARYSNVLTMTATAYDLSFQSTGRKPGDKYYGLTASGTKIRPGVAAVDPNVIPLGTKLYVESLDGTPDYGYASAEDKGGAIKGNKIDLYIKSAQDVRKFGRRKVKVYILK
ncbi:MAG TPA: 3D domain-containing protein, partial [Oscillospiraceae bacterium]|nr:3D domain-containing protein [Oscillospiraceae bacterium]